MAAFVWQQVVCWLCVFLCAADARAHREPFVSSKAPKGEANKRSRYSIIKTPVCGNLQFCWV